MEKKIEWYKNSLVYILLLFVSLGVGLVLPSNPFSQDNLPMMDSSVFYYIGRVLAKGGTLYIDATDHKGPVIFFLNYVAVLLGEKHYIGLWLLEMFAFYSYLLSQYFIGRLLGLTHFRAGLSTAVMAILVPVTLDASGNAVEFWALPCIGWSLYLFCRYYLKDRTVYPLPFILSGMFCMIAALLRFNQVALWIAFALVAVIHFMIRKEWKNLGLVSIYFIIGGGVILLPLVGYHVLTDSLSEAFHQSWVVNIHYTQTRYITSVSELVRTFLDKTMMNKVLFITVFYAFAVCYRCFSRKSLTTNQVLLHLSVVLSLFINLCLILSSGRIYNHYFLLLYPEVGFCLVYIVLVVGRFRFGNILLLCSLLFALTFQNMYKASIQAMFQIVPPQAVESFSPSLAKKIERGQKTYYTRYVEYQEVATYIKENSSKEDVIYSQRPEVYIASERYSPSRYFSLPYMYIEEDSPILSEFMADVEAKMPVFIVLTKEEHPKRLFENVRKKLMEKIAMNYTEVYSGEQLVMYQLRK